MNSIKTKKAKYSSKNLLFALALIISCVGCEGQISSKKRALRQIVWVNRFNPPKWK